MILTWAGLISLLIPLAHASGAKYQGKDLSVSTQRLLIKAREFMDKKEYN